MSLQSCSAAVLRQHINCIGIHAPGSSPLLPRSQDINHPLHLGVRRWWAATGELQGMGGYSIYGALGCRMDKLLLTVVDIFCFSGNISPILLFLQKCLHFQKRIFRHAVGGSYKHLHFFFCSCLATGNQCCRCNCIMLQCFCRQSYQKCSKMNCKLSFDCAKIFWFCGKFTGFLSRVCWLLQQPQ